jgi:hypothetical protein
MPSRNACRTLTESSDDVITHLGNGILLTACEGRSALTKDALHVAPGRDRWVPTALRAA